MAELKITLINGKEAGATMQLVNKEIREAKKEIDKAKIGTDEYVKATKKLELAEGNLKKVNDQLKSTAAASNTLKQSFLGVLNQIPGFSALSGALSNAKGGVGGLTSGFGLLKGAIAATGIGLLIILLTSLVSWFKNTERGADLLEKGMRMAGAAVNVLRDRAAKLIDALIAFATGNWTEAAVKFGEATKGVTAEIMEEVKAAGKLADALDALEELEGKLILVRSRSKEQISELLLMSKDETLSLEKRAAAIEKAIKIQRAMNAAELEAKKGRVLQALEVSNLDELTAKYGATLDDLLARGEDILSVDNLGMGESTQKDLNAAMEALAAYNNQLALSNDEERTMRKQLNTLKSKDRAEDTKDSKAASQKEKEALQEKLAAEENLIKLSNERKLALIDDARQREIEKLAIDTENKITALQGSEMQVLEQTKILRDLQGIELAAIDKKYADSKAAEENKARLEKEEADKVASDKAKQLAKEEADYQRELSDAKLSLQSQALGAAISLLGEDEKARKKNAAAIKAFTIAQIITDTQREIAGYMANPASTATLGAVGTIKTIGALIRAGLAIAKVSSQKFETGGMVTGPRHSGGGVPIEAEGGEFIFSRKAVAAIGVDNLSAVNNRYTFANGGQVPVSPYQAQTSQSNPTGGMSQMENKITELVNAINMRIDRIQVVNNVGDTEKGIKVLNTIRNDADV